MTRGVAENRHGLWKPSGARLLPTLPLLTSYFYLFQIPFQKKPDIHDSSGRFHLLTLQLNLLLHPSRPTTTVLITWRRPFLSVQQLKQLVNHLLLVPTNTVSKSFPIWSAYTTLKVLQQVFTLVNALVWGVYETRKA